ncbi:hypothetical protein EG329_005026 [Mollisiaceae sp. DMI_Dod_QoI]|nr:hypothetical protein EG329_005026 [Helotiales sp. DMI_Dod_QoI]
MAPRRGAAEVVAEEPQLGGLTFNEPLSWRAGKPIPTGDLLRRLDALSTELRDMDQEETDKDSLTKVAKELAGQNLLSHKDKGVRAFTACCLVDVLKICAPDAPFTPSQLKDIFTLFVTSILPALSDPSHAYNTQHKYVLVSLSEVKSIVLLCDIQNSDSLILHLFSSFFDMISGSSKSSTGEQISKDVEYHMTQMLVTLVDEAQSLPTDVVDVIMAQFIRAILFPAGKTKQETDEKQSTLLLKELPEAYNMAKTICNSCPEKMSRYVSQYFNEVILEVSGGVSKPNGHRRTSDAAADSDDDEAPAGSTDSDLKELKKAHNLLREMWRASPAVLQNVIPQLDAELSAENVQLRCLATETLGDIISGIGAAGPPPSPHMDPAAYPPAKLEDYPQGPISPSILTTPISPQSFAQTHPAVYQSFMGRKNDKSAIIRSAWTSAIGRILVTSAGGIGLSPHEESSLVKGLAEKLNDADEKVRLAAVKVVGEFGFRDIMTKLASSGSVNKQGSVLCSLADRARDRRLAVRSEAMTIICRIWGVAAGEIAAGNESVVEALGTIPSKVFDAFYANDRETNVLLDHVMFEQLIPLGYPPAKGKSSKATNGESQGQMNGDGPFDADKIRTERILFLIKSLDSKARKAFFAMQANQPTFSKVMDIFLKRCEDFNGGVVDADAKDIKNKLDSTIKWLADFLPDSFRASHDLQKYAKLHDRRSYQLLRFAMAPESDFSTVHKAIKEFQKRISSAPGGQAGLLDTLMPIIYRSACLVYNRSHQPLILQYSRTDENGLSATAHLAMKEISDKHPEIFKASVTELCKSLEDQAPSDSKENDPSSVDTLKALASFAKAENNQIPNDRKFTQTLLNFALYGTPPKAAKYAVSILVATTNRKEMHMKDLLDQSMDGWEYGKDHFLTKLATISQLTLLDHKLTEDFNDEIIDITTQQILLKTRTPKTDEDPEWQSGKADDECEAKCWAIKTLVNRLRTVDDPETAKKLAVPVYKLLNALIVKGGELSKSNDTPRHHKSRLRVLAAQQMLKLCTKKMFDDFLSPIEFIKLSFISQDALEIVRRGFIEKLQKYIVKNRLSHRFYTIIFLTAFEPGSNGAFKESIMTWIRSRAKIHLDAKSRVFESILPRLIHLLAHHPDFSTEPEELKDIGTYFLYYLNTVASEENLSLIYKCAQRVKQAKDAIAGVDADNIYVMSDLAQALVKMYEEKKGWSMQTWPAKVGLPVGLFASLPSHEVAQDIAEKNYLPEEMDDLLDRLVRDADKKKKRKSDDREDGSHPSKKIKSEGKPRPTKTPTVKREKPVKEKKTPKPKKVKPATSTPAASSVDRRRSGRGASAKKSYADRDDDEDDEEMMDGVASWEYMDGSGEEEAKDDGSDAGSAPEEVEEEEAVVSETEAAEPEPEPEPEVEEPEEEPEPEPAEEEEEAEEEIEEAESTPAPATNGKRASRSSAKKPVASASKVTKSKPAPRAKTKPKSPIAKAATRARATAKSPLAKTKKGQNSAAKGKGKGKASRTKDVFDMDESE